MPAAIVARELNIRLIDTFCVATYDDEVKGQVKVLKSVEGDGEGLLIVDDLVDTGATAKVVRERLPKAPFRDGLRQAGPAGRWSIPMSPRSARIPGSIFRGIPRSNMWRRSAAAVTRGGGAGIASPPSYARGYALLIGVALGWGFNWPLMKIIVTEVPVWQFRGFSGIAAGLLLLGLAIAVSRGSGEAWRTPREQWLRLCLAALFNVTSWFIFIGYGVSMMGAGHAVIMGFTMPLFAAVFGVTFLGEPMTRRRLAALCLGAAGIAVLMSHDFSVIGAEPLGFVLTLIGAACGRSACSSRNTRRGRSACWH